MGTPCFHTLDSYREIFDSFRRFPDFSAEISKVPERLWPRNFSDNSDNDRFDHGNGTRVLAQRKRLIESLSCIYTHTHTHTHERGNAKQTEVTRNRRVLSIFVIGRVSRFDFAVPFRGRNSI